MQTSIYTCNKLSIHFIYWFFIVRDQELASRFYQDFWGRDFYGGVLCRYLLVSDIARYTCLIPYEGARSKSLMDDGDLNPSWRCDGKTPTPIYRQDIDNSNSSYKALMKNHPKDIIQAFKRYRMYTVLHTLLCKQTMLT